MKIASAPSRTQAADPRADESEDLLPGPVPPPLAAAQVALEPLPPATRFAAARPAVIPAAAIAPAATARLNGRRAVADPVLDPVSERGAPARPLAGRRLVVRRACPARPAGAPVTVASRAVLPPARRPGAGQAPRRPRRRERRPGLLSAGGPGRPIDSPQNSGRWPSPTASELPRLAAQPRTARRLFRSSVVWLELPGAISRGFPCSVDGTAGPAWPLVGIAVAVAVLDWREPRPRSPPLAVCQPLDRAARPVVGATVVGAPEARVIPR